MASNANDGPQPARPDQLRRAGELIGQLLERRRTGEEPDLDQLILDNPSLAAVLEEQLQSLRAAWSIETGPRVPLGGPPPGLASSAQPGGRYEVLDVRGSGSFSVVYRAFDRALKRVVALKVLRPRATGSTLAHALREGRASAQLTHPNIVPIYDIGTADGCVYLSMHLVEGGTLADYLGHPGRRPAFRTSALLLRQLAQALDYAHSRGVVHRDVKPANVLMDGPDVPRFIDFGLARTLEAEAEAPRHEEVTGSPAYMAPEQAAGRSGEADGRADVFGLGVVMYELLTGQRPFVANCMEELLRQIREETPVPPRRHVPAVPLDLELICLKALEKEPDDRFATAGAMETELGRWLNGDPPGLRRQTLWERARRWGRRNPMVAALTTTALLVLVAVGVLGSLAWVQHQRARLEAENADTKARLLAEVEQQRAELAIRSLVATAWRRLNMPTAGRRREAQDRLRETAKHRRLLREGPQRDQLDQEIRSVFVSTLGVPELIADNPLELGLSNFLTWSAAIQPDGEAMAIGTPRGPVWWIRGRRPELPPGLDPNEPRPRVWLSPDGRYLVFAPQDGELRLYDGTPRTEPKLLPLQEPTGKPILAVGFDNESRTLSACREDGRVQTWLLSDGQPGQSRTIRLGAGAMLTASAFAASAERLAVGDDQGRVLLVGALGGEPRQLFTAQSTIDALAWSTDGSRLAVGARDGSVHLCDERGSPLHRFFLYPTGVTNILFDPAGQWLLAGRSGTMMMWNVATGEQLLTARYTPWAFSRDGRRFAGGNGSGVVFGDLPPSPVQRLIGHRLPVELLAWCRDSRHLASMDTSCEVRVWDITQPVAIDDFSAPQGDYYPENAAVSLSDDARQVAYASGGRTPVMLIRELKGKVVQRWKELPKGFDRLAFARGTFLSVREEYREGRWDTVARELVAGKALPVGRIVRRAEKGEQLFLTSNLTPDGRYSCWVGPRRPAANRRVEVREVATGKLIRCIRVPTEKETPEPGAFLDAQGRYLMVSLDNRHWRHDLEVAGDSESIPNPGFRLSPDQHRFLTGVEGKDEFRDEGALALGRWPAGPVLAELYLRGLPSRAGGFSPDSRHVAWIGERGVIFVTDLEALEAEVRRFEAELRAE